MTGLDHILPHVVPFGLVIARISGLFIFTPLLSSIVIPTRLKALMILALSVAVYPLAPVGISGAHTLGFFDIVPAMLTEALIGASIGILAAVPLLSLEMSGVMIGQQMGFGLAKVFNPEANFDTDLLGQLLFYVAAGAFLSFGGLETAVGALVHTFERVPTGGFHAGHVPLDVLVGSIVSGFELAFRVAAPVTATILLLVIILGVIGKTMPQINIMSVGFTFKVLAGLGVMAASLYAAQGSIGDEVIRGMGAVIEWVRGL